MRNKFALFLLILAITGCVTALADNPVVSIIDKSGGKTAVAQADIARINLSQESVEIVKRNDERLVFDKEDIVRIELVSGNAEEVSLTSDNSDVKMTISNHIVSINGLQEDMPCNIYSTNGMLCKSVRCNQISNSFSIADLRRGVYIMTIGKYVFKIIK